MPANHNRKQYLQTAPRTVIGYHGCSRNNADRILVENWFLPSTKTYDWLGEGVYFWEYAPYRALEWAKAKCAPSGEEPAVIRATIRLGRCLNMLDFVEDPMKKRLDPHSREVIDAVVARIRKMTPEEALAFLTYKTPGIEETDMTGMFPIDQKPPKIVRSKRTRTAA